MYSSGIGLTATETHLLTGEDMTFAVVYIETQNWPSKGKKNLDQGNAYFACLYSLP